MLMLYLIDGMPAAAQLRIRVCIDSISRSRSGLWASIMAPCFSRSMWLEARNGGARQSTLIPCFPARSRMLLSSSTVAYRRPSAIWGIAADVADSVAGEVLQVRLIGGGALAPEFHASRRRRSGGISRRQTAAEHHGGGAR